MFRYEWCRFKRVLQVHHKKRHHPRKLPNDMFFRRLYRLERGQEDWEALLGHSGGDSGSHSRDEAVAMKYEYLRSVLKPQQFYSIDLTRQEVQGDGSAVDVTEEVIWQVLTCHTKQEASKRTPTSIEDIAGVTLARHCLRSVLV